MCFALMICKLKTRIHQACGIQKIISIREIKDEEP